MSSYAFAKLYSKSCCRPTIDFISFKKKTYKFYNATLIVNIFQFIVASILHYCSLHRNAQYGLVPFRVLKLKIEDWRTLRAAAQPRNVRYWHSAACCISGRRMSMIYCSQLHGKQEFRAAIYKCPPTSLLQGHAIWLHTPCWPLWQRALQ